ncbi:MAG: stress response translation initiation inhibitor YciH [Chloroflexi bacterium]|nr:stress response translation initiation inhibitor YciH [Chloroflexota bacterium]
MRRSRPGEKVVFSTDPEEEKTKPEKPAQRVPPQQQTVYLSRDRKNRGGKTVTLISGLQLSEAELKSLTKDLKARCGAGGTLKDGNIEIQGDHREKLGEVLAGMGYKVKFAGG